MIVIYTESLELMNITMIFPFVFLIYLTIVGDSITIACIQSQYLDRLKS